MLVGDGLERGDDDLLQRRLGRLPLPQLAGEEVLEEQAGGAGLHVFRAVGEAADEHLPEEVTPLFVAGSLLDTLEGARRGLERLDHLRERQDAIDVLGDPCRVRACGCRRLARGGRCAPLAAERDQRNEKNGEGSGGDHPGILQGPRGGAKVVAESDVGWVCRASVALPLLSDYDGGMKLSQQVVLVSGAGRGLGSAIARAFAKEGARVVVNYRASRDAAEALAGEIGAGQAVALQADVTDPAQVGAMFEAARAHFDAPVTTVVNNALADFSFNGDGRPKAESIEWGAFASQLEGSVRGGLNVIQAAIPAMRERGFGRVVNIGTNLFQHPVVPYHDYTASKAALLSLTRTMAADLGPMGITVNMVSGGLLRTTDASSATPEEVFDMIAANTPLRSVTTPAEFADAVLFFASPWSRAVTGQNLVVDGGLVKD